MKFISSNNYNYSLSTLFSLIILIENNYLFISSVECINAIIWNKNDNNFIQIFNIQSFDQINNDILLLSRNIEKHNFNGKELKLTSFPINNLIDFIENDTLITGVHGDMWQLLSEMLNFKIRSVKINNGEYGRKNKNGSWDGLIGYVYRNETDVIPRSVISSSRLTALDYTLAIWITEYKFCMKGQLQYHRTWMKNLFSNEIWFSVIGIFIALTFANYSIHLSPSNFISNDIIIDKNMKNKNTINDIRDHFFYIFSILCNQGWTPHQLEKRSKIILLSTRIFSWLLVIAFSSKLTSQIAQRRYKSSFNDIESFYNNTNYKLIVKGNSFVYSIFKSSNEPIYKNILDDERIIELKTTDAYEKICNENYVYLESHDVVEAENSILCEIICVGKPFLTTWIAGGLTRGFKYRKTIDLGMLKLNEFGLTNRLKSKWLKKSREKKISQTYVSISLEHVSLIFAMLFSAIILSIVILIIENIIHT